MLFFSFCFVSLVPLNKKANEKRTQRQANPKEKDNQHKSPRANQIQDNPPPNKRRMRTRLGLAPKRPATAPRRICRWPATSRRRPPRPRGAVPNVSLPTGGWGAQRGAAEPPAPNRARNPAGKATPTPQAVDSAHPHFFPSNLFRRRMRGKTKCHPEAHLGAPHSLGKRLKPRGLPLVGDRLRGDRGGRRAQGSVPTAAFAGPGANRSTPPPSSGSEARRKGQARPDRQRL